MVSRCEFRMLKVIRVKGWLAWILKAALMITASASQFHVYSTYHV